MDSRSKGLYGEDIAADYLKAAGFQIVERNFRCKMGEIDIIAKKGGEVYFVEVKARKSRRFGDPLESITLNKQRQIVKISKFFLMKLKKEVACHFSAIGIILGVDGADEINFIEDAFTTP